MAGTLCEYVDIREVHPDYRRAECWYCGNTWLEEGMPNRVCHECYMGQQKVDFDGECVVDGYTDYGRLWYGEVEDRSEYQELYEESTAEISERIERRRAREREVRV